MIRHITKFLIKSLKVIGFIAGLGIVFFALPYLLTPRYNFPEPKPFSGDSFWNPYATADSTQWIKANFHMHAHEWGGITHGTCTPDEIWATYKNLGFQSLAISNYQKINKLNHQSDAYIPTYEHGFGIFKNHHLCLGAKKVLWFDYIFKQGIHQKQHVLFKLRPTTQLLSINHPSFAGGFYAEDFSKLTNYDFIEAVNGYRVSIPHWDAALSAGKPVFLLADDDAHNIKLPKEVARCFSLINTASNSQTAVFAAMKAGKVIGVSMPMQGDTTFELRKERLQNLPQLKNVITNGDTITLELDKVADKIEFHGQNGEVISSVEAQSRATYIAKPSDTYVRAELFFQNDLHYYLNPLFRVQNHTFPANEIATVNPTATWLYRLLGFGCLGILIGLIFYIRKYFRKH